MLQDDQIAPEDEQDDEVKLTPAELKAALLESQRREREANAAREAERARVDALIRSASPVGTPPPANEPMLGAMPDPSVEPEEFQKWIDRRDAQRDRRMQQELSQRDAEISGRQAASDLWNRFVSRFPDYAKLQQLASVAFQQVIPSFGGIIPSDPGRVEELMNSVKRTMDDMRGVAPSAPRSRTNGVSDGSPAPRPPRSSVKEEEKTTTLAEDILDWQLSQGLI